MDLPHFERASRRAFIQRGLAASGLVAAGAALAACSSSDAEVFARGTNAPGAVSTTLAPTTTSAATATPTTTAATTTATTARTATGAHPGTITFSYAASDSSGRVRNPFIAVWVEDSSSTLVAVVSVWYQSRESKYLRELTEFTAAGTDVGGAQLDAVSGATRAAGRYDLAWDGIGLDGSVLSGPYTLWIEAAREHGPHSVTSGPVELGRAGTATLPAGGELSAAEVTVA